MRYGARSRSVGPADTGLLHADAPVQAGGWYTLALLSLLFSLSFIDRQILSLLADPVSKSLGLNDSLLGLLLGGSFGMTYALVGLPLASWADRYGRLRLIVAGVVVWGVTTVLSALASGFVTLAFCRVGVAVGEAALAPAAISAIADIFPRHSRALPMGVFNAIPPLMSTGSLLIGGGALRIAVAISGDTGLEPWRWTFILVGAPSVLIGLLCLASVSEPLRRKDRSNWVADRDQSSSLWSYLVEHSSFYLPFMGGVGLICIVVYGMFSWTVTMLVRSFAMNPESAGYAYGLFGVTGSVAGALLGPVVGQRLGGGRGDGPFVMLMVSIGVGGAAVAIAPRMSGWLAVLAMMWPAFVGFGAITALATICVQSIAPSHLRARLSAVQSLAINFIGFALGPLLVGILSDHIFAGQYALASSLSTVALIFTPLALAFFLLCQRAFRDELVHASLTVSADVS